MKPSTTSRKYLIRALAVLFWLGVWQIMSMVIGQEILLVSPVRAAKTLIDMAVTAAFWQSVFSSFGRILLGFALATALGLGLAVLAGMSRAARALFEPLMHAVKATPVASFVILALIFIRSTYLSVFISFRMVLPIMYTNILAGVDAADPKLLEMAKVFRVGPLRRAGSVYLAAVYPHFLAACALALGMCWKAGVAAEVIGYPRHSIGEALYLAKLNFDTPDIFAWTLAVILLSVGFEKLILAATRRLGRSFGGE
ncbi:MAG: ABC transporter permease subunit [Clostridia bacterium]|nr:ABC transporter permease subunit [Clostridia bacterium]